ncbi:MAG: OmpH family outer membrane protein, partial [Gemmatimonadota bacterium]|nr:OmpH family outer membrane protein [Gemmatimonadota bacterium]
LEQTLQQRQSELLGPIMDRIITATEQVRAAGNFSMVFDAGSGGLVTADPSLDLSDQVLSRLRSMP